MATITLTNLINGDGPWYGDAFEVAGPQAITAQTATTLKFTTSGGHVVTITGTGFAYDGLGGAPSAGTITGFSLVKGGQLWASGKSMAVDFTTAFYTGFGYSRGPNGQQNGDSFGVWSLITAGDDTINGSAGDDDLIAGRNGGNDTINGLAGDDFIKGSAGNNKMLGGTGDDTLTYEEGAYDAYAIKGASINAVTGKVLNPWGGTDTISGFERYYGSMMADTFLGSVIGETFTGYRGADKFDGGATNNGDWDRVDYQREINFGGGLGISANLATGVIIDSFGARDTVKNIEVVIGTIFNDKFVGDALDNEFVGGKGIDTYDGGGGNDTIAFYRNDPGQGAVGVVVNLGLTTKQVTNDGYGKVESVVRIENVGGSQLADTLTGDSAGNRLKGEEGNDTLSGSGGNDRLDGAEGRDTMTGGTGLDVFFFNDLADLGLGAAKRDIIKDFTPGQDDIDLSDIPDANLTTAGEQNFVFRGTAAFTAPGQVRYAQVGAATATTTDDHTIISVNTGGSLAADFEIDLVGLKTLSATDFIFV